LTQHPCAPLQDHQRAQTPHHPEQKNAHERDLREVSANAHEQNNPQVYNGHFFCQFAFFARQQVATISDVRNQKIVAAQKSLLAVDLAFFFAKVAFFFGNKGF
jgi:hypothetical protein